MDYITLNRWGLSESIIKEAQQDHDRLYIARVIEQHKTLYTIQTEMAKFRGEVLGRMINSADGNIDYPVVGDWVLVDRIDGSQGNAAIHKILTRKSCFVRKIAGKQHQIQGIAANIDKVFICMGLNNDFNLRRLERYLTLAWESRATPIVVLTKADLCTDIETKLEQVEAVAIGVDIMITSSIRVEGYTDLLPYLVRRETVAFLGSSGVGKSTLINALMGKAVMDTAQTRNDDRGRHTTTHRQMFILPEGCIVMDTPGMRELQLASADLGHTFAEIEKLSKQCRFKDCSHQEEPGCAVREAIENSTLAEERLESYRKLGREQLFEERKSSLTAAQVQKQKTIDMMGSLNAHKQILKHHRKLKKR